MCYNVYGETRMKKILYIICLLLVPFSIFAKEEVTLNKCVDGDTAWFNLNGETIKVRFLAINTPESTNKIEKYGKEASEFTCNLLTTAKKIEIEYDEKADKLDKYNRYLAWVFVDDKLLQDLIVREGYAEIKYVYDDYKYLDTLNKSLKLAKKEGLNLWSNEEYLFIIFGYKITKEILLSTISVLIILIACIFSDTIRKKTNTKLKRKINKKIDDMFK